LLITALQQSDVRGERTVLLSNTDDGEGKLGQTDARGQSVCLLGNQTQSEMLIAMIGYRAFWQV
jgi:hypothetical protein